MEIGLCVVQFRGNRARNFQSDSRYALGRFEVTRPITPSHVGIQLQVSNLNNLKLDTIPVSGHLRHSRVNHRNLAGFFLAVFHCFVKPIEHITVAFHTKEVHENFSNFVIGMIN